VTLCITPQHYVNGQWLGFEEQSGLRLPRAATISADFFARRACCSCCAATFFRNRVLVLANANAQAPVPLTGFATGDSERIVLGEFNLDKAAAALLSQHGERAVRVAEERASRHEIAKEKEVSELWRAVAQAVRRKLASGRS
jgi:hypothetical protein